MSRTPSTCLVPLVPLVPHILLILIYIFKDDWMHLVTPFQNLKFHQSVSCKICLLIIKVLRAPFFPVPRCPVPPNSMNKLTLSSQQKLHNLESKNGQERKRPDVAQHTTKRTIPHVTYRFYDRRISMIV